MNKKRNIKKFLRRTVELFVASSGVLLYAVLSHRMIDGALLVTTGTGVLTFLLLVALGWGAVAIFPYPGEEIYPEDEEAEPFSEKDEDIPSAELSAPADMPIEEYPELFNFREKEEKNSFENTSEARYRENLKNAIAAQKVQYDPDDEKTFEKSATTTDFFENVKEREVSIPDIYDSVPETLPEGYILPEDRWEKEDDPGKETDVEQSGLSVKNGWRIRVVCAAVMLAVCLGAAYLFGSSGTVFFEDDFAVRTAAGEKIYTWEDCVRYEIAPSFFGDRLTVTMYTKDGKKIKLLSSGTSTGERFSQQYSSVYSYVLYACEKMDEGGAEKTVKERKTIESELAVREDIGETVRKLID